MTFETKPQLQFGDAAAVDASLSERARGLIGSEILKIASEIRALVRAGRTICNLTVGDFAASQFPIPVGLRDAIIEALHKGETNYPPSDGLLALREAVLEHVARTVGVRYPLESVLIASGARPLLYASYRCVLDPAIRSSTRCRRGTTITMHGSRQRRRSKSRRAPRTASCRGWNNCDRISPRHACWS